MAARPTLKHAEWIDHPRNHGRRLVRLLALCGQYYDAATEFEHVDKVTCPKCRAILDARESMTV